MAVVRRVSLFSREVAQRLSTTALELLLARGSRLSEGQLTADGHYYGSTMITLDVRQLGDVLAGPRRAVDGATATRLARHLAADPAVVERLRGLANDEAQRIAGTPLCILGAELRVRGTGNWIFLDVDVEGDVHAVEVAARGSAG